MKVHKRILTALVSLALVAPGTVWLSAPVQAASPVTAHTSGQVGAQVVANASYPITNSPPCSPSGTYAGTSYGSNPGEGAHLSECYSGGYWYVRPLCRAQGGVTDESLFPYPGPYVYFVECKVFVWIGCTYQTYYGFTDFSVNTGQDAYTSWYMPVGAIRLSGVTVSSEVCASSAFYFVGGIDPDHYAITALPCTQSSPHALGS
jgi:hypothetical protein